MSSRVVPLGELCEMDRQGLRPEDPVAARLPLLGVEHVVSDTGALNLGSGSRIGDGKSTSFRFDERHVLYAKLRPYLNKVATPDFAGRCSTELVPLLPRRGVDREYLAHLLRRKETVAFVMSSVTGSRMPRADMKALMSMPVPHPSLGEQRRIVDILNRAARIEALRSRAAERLREFVPALFVKVFGDPARNPMAWPLLTLRDVSTLGPQYGANAPAVPFTEGRPRYIRITDIHPGGHLSDEPVGLDHADWEPYRLRDGDLLLARSGATVGKAYIYRQTDGPCVFAGYLIRFRLNYDKLHPLVAFAFTQTSAYRAWIETKRRTAAQPNINGREYATLEIPVPPLHLQERFTKIVNSAQSLVACADSGHRRVSGLSACLMADCFGHQIAQCGPFRY